MELHEHLYVGGRWVPAATGKWIDVLDPTTAQAFARVPRAGDEDVDRAVDAAHAAQPEWAATPPAERADALRRLAGGLQRRQAELADLLVREAGIPYSLAHGHQTSFPIRMLEQQAFLIESHVLEERVGGSLVLREPVGVVAALAPWNFPLLLAINKVAPALAAGCAVILKPSEQSPLHALVLAETADQAQLPAGVFNVLTGNGPEVGRALAAHPRIAMVSFTGSTEAGRRVGSLAGATLKRVQLELGGKSANVVLDDADVELAVRTGVQQCFWNSGQSCMAWSRLLAPHALHDDIAELAAAVAREHVVGDPRDPRTLIGPMISARQAQRVRDLVGQGCDEGAVLVAGGSRRPAELGDGFFVQPTVLAGVRNDMAVARQEIFGPVLSIIPYHHGDDEAVQIANDSPYGLHGAVFSADQARALDVARRLQTGMVDINGAPLNEWAPFGGYKASGIGRELGRHGLDEYFELKSVQCRFSPTITADRRS